MILHFKSTQVFDIWVLWLLVLVFVLEKSVLPCFTVSEYYVVLASQARRLLVAKWYEPYGIVDTRDTCAVSRYFLLLRYTAVYRDLGDTGIVR